MDNETSREKLTYKVTLDVTRTLCIVVLVTIISLALGLYDSRVDNSKIFELITPVLQTIVGGFIGLLAGIKLANNDSSKKDCQK
jgi:undecaprenyl pyrophosphate phosphatase UppP